MIIKLVILVVLLYSPAQLGCALCQSARDTDQKERQRAWHTDKFPAVFDPEQFFGEVRSKVVRKARASGLSPADAEDCAQDAITSLLRLLEHQPERAEQPEKLRGWLFMKADSLQIDYYRRAEARPEQPFVQTDIHGDERLQEFVSLLPSPQEEAEAREIERGFPLSSSSSLG